MVLKASVWSHVSAAPVPAMRQNITTEDTEYRAKAHLKTDRKPEGIRGGVKGKASPFNDTPKPGPNYLVPPFPIISVLHHWLGQRPQALTDLLWQWVRNLWVMTPLGSNDPFIGVT